MAVKITVTQIGYNISNPLSIYTSSTGLIDSWSLYGYATHAELNVGHVLTGTTFQYYKVQDTGGCGSSLILTCSGSTSLTTTTTTLSGGTTTTTTLPPTTTTTTTGSWYYYTATSMSCGTCLNIDFGLNVKSADTLNIGEYYYDLNDTGNVYHITGSGGTGIDHTLQNLAGPYLNCAGMPC